jgi:hypothetical protein
MISEVGPAIMGSKFKLALIQLAVGGNKVENLARAVLKISEAVENGAQIVSLPGNQLFKPTFLKLYRLYSFVSYGLNSDPLYTRNHRVT